MQANLRAPIVLPMPRFRINANTGGAPGPKSAVESAITG
jgi:hypothetical protein